MTTSTDGESAHLGASTLTLLILAMCCPEGLILVFAMIGIGVTVASIAADIGVFDEVLE